MHNNVGFGFDHIEIAITLEAIAIRIGHLFACGQVVLTTRSKDATSNKCHASSNRCLTSSNKKLLGTRALLLGARMLLGAKGIATRNKKLRTGLPYGPKYG